MKRLNKLVFTIAIAAVALTPPARAVYIDLTLYNTEPLLDETSTPLQGNPSSGDLIQLILAGNNNAIDAPDLYGGAGGDDSLLFAAHIGEGISPFTPDVGLVAKLQLSAYLDSWAGTNVYVRFWNAASSAGATYYGYSALFLLPAGDVFNYAELDFAPSSSYNHITDQPWTQLSVIPEPSNLFLFGLFVWVLIWWRVKTKEVRHGVIGGRRA